MESVRVLRTEREQVARLLAFRTAAGTYQVEAIDCGAAFEADSLEEALREVVVICADLADKARESGRSMHFTPQPIDLAVFEGASYKDPESERELLERAVVLRTTSWASFRSTEKQTEELVYQLADSK